MTTPKQFSLEITDPVLKKRFDDKIAEAQKLQRELAEKEQERNRVLGEADEIREQAVREDKTKGIIVMTDKPIITRPN